MIWGLILPKMFKVWQIKWWNVLCYVFMFLLLSVPQRGDSPSLFVLVDHCKREITKWVHLYYKDSCLREGVSSLMEKFPLTSCYDTGEGCEIRTNGKQTEIKTDFFFFCFPLSWAGHTSDPHPHRGSSVILLRPSSLHSLLGPTLPCVSVMSSGCCTFQALVKHTDDVPLGPPPSHVVNGVMCRAPGASWDMHATYPRRCLGHLLDSPRRIKELTHVQQRPSHCNGWRLKGLWTLVRFFSP